MNIEREFRVVENKLDIVTIDGKLLEKKLANILEFRRMHNLIDSSQSYNALKVLIVDNKFYDDYMDALNQDAKVEKTSEHESAHELTALAFGWFIKSVQADQDQGLTVCVPPPNISFRNWLIQSGAISTASTVGAQMLGEKPRGTGSDDAYVSALAALAVKTGEFSSIQEYMTITKSCAHSALGSMGGSAALIKRGQKHAKQGLTLL